jgi:hypothetical protein
MSTPLPVARSGKLPTFGFLVLMVAAAACNIAGNNGLLSETTAKQAIGVIIGVTIASIGYFLPRLRPASDAITGAVKFAAAGRFGGWLLGVAGLAYVALFVFSPLATANVVATLIGIATLVLIAAYWTWLVRGVLFKNPPSAGQGAAGNARAAGRRKLLIRLLVLACGYVAATACVAFLFAERPWIQGLALWMVLMFWMMYAAVVRAFLNFKTAQK